MCPRTSRRTRTSKIFFFSGPSRSRIQPAYTHSYQLAKSSKSLLPEDGAAPDADCASENQHSETAFRLLARNAVPTQDEPSSVLRRSRCERHKNDSQTKVPRGLFATVGPESGKDSNDRQRPPP